MTVVCRDYAGGKQEVDVRITLPNGDKIRRKKVLDMSKSAARRWAEAYEKDLYSKAMSATMDGGSIESRTVLTLEAFGPRFVDEYCRANQHKLSGVQSKETVLKKYLYPVLGHKRLNEISDADIAKLKSALTELKPKTVNNVLSVLSKLLHVAMEWRVILDMPCRITLLRTQDVEMQFYEVEQYDRLVRAAAKLGVESELLVRLGGDLGLRRGEILALRMEHLDLVRHTANVSRNQVRGAETDLKGMEARRVPMSPGLVALLKGPIAGVKGHLLSHEDGSPLTPKMVRRRMAKIEKAAELGGSGALHILRHTYCSHLAMSGLTVHEIQKLAGHANLTTTLQYMHLSPTHDLQKSAGMLDALRQKNSGATSTLLEE